MHRHASNAESHVALAMREYPHGTRARYNAAKCRCQPCRRANADYESQRQRDPRISADPVRRHIEQLAAQGIGLRAISDATDVPRVALKRWVLGQPTIRRSVAERILATDATIIADCATVDATETWRLLRELVREGYTKTRLAALLGSEARVPSLQIRQGRVLAKTEHRVRKLHAALMAEASDDVLIDESPRIRILSALRWFDAVHADELFDAMDVAHDDRDAHMQALHRLWKAGDIERTGSKPFAYRIRRDHA